MLLLKTIFIYKLHNNAASVISTNIVGRVLSLCTGVHTRAKAIIVSTVIYCIDDIYRIKIAYKGLKNIDLLTLRLRAYIY